jgi:hypothetical protein
MFRLFTRRTLRAAAWPVAAAALATGLSACKNDEGSAAGGTRDSAMMAAMNATCTCGQPVSRSAPTTGYMGHTIGFCCATCASRWNSMSAAQKDQFMQRQMAMMGAMNDHCVCGAPVVKGAPMTSFKGHLIGFCDSTCASKWNSMSAAQKDQFIEEQMSTMRTTNSMCWCGQPVIATAPTATYMGRKVGFCCSTCASKWKSMSDSERAQYMSTIAGHSNR